MKAAVWYGGQDIRIEDVPNPEVGKEDVLIRVKAVGICGSELHAYDGISKRRVPPLIMGHEFSGEIAETGENVTEFAKGNRVVVNPLIRCGTCEPCSLGYGNVCRHLRLIGMHKSGALAEYTSAPASNCHLLPEQLSFEEGALVEPFAVGVHAVNRASIQIGDTIVVVGTGIIGLMIIQAAKASGSHRIFVTDLFDYKLNIARRLGADFTVNARTADPANHVLGATKEQGADVVFEAVGLETTLRQATKMTKPLGNLVVVGNLAKNVQFDIMDIVTREIDVYGSYSYTSKEFKRALDFMNDERIDVKYMITNVLSLDKTKNGFELLSKKEMGIVKVLVRP
jgi:threonine dehydrogenase-like Zn-dependent dehydrogenase